MRRLALILLPLAVVACDTTTESVHRPEPVVEAYLEADQDLPRVRLSETASIDGTFDVATGAITGASIRIDEIGEDGETRNSTPYGPLRASPGVYVPVATEMVRAGGRYRLTAVLPDGSLIEAETVVPAGFDLLDRNADEVIYQGSEQFEIELSPSSYPGRDPIYLITLEGLDPRPARLTPIYLDAIYELDPGDPFDPDTLDVSELQDFIVVSSPPLNEANYREEGESTVTATLPWFSVVFYGPARIRVSAIDDNIYDFIRYQAVQRGGSTLSPGEIPNVRDGISGGVGIFGSFAAVETVVEILEPPD